MKKNLLILFTSLSFAQAPFNKEFPNVLTVKGMVYFNLFRPHLGYSLGIEKSFLKNNSIGINYFYDVYIPRTELVTDKFGVKHDRGDYEYDIDKTWTIAYKYYFPLAEFSHRFGISPYLSVSYLYRTNTIEKDQNYVHDFYSQNTKSTYLGPMMGVNFLLSKYSKWTIDTQLGYLYGRKSTITNYEVPYKFVLDETYKTEIFRFELMVAYNIDLD